MMEANGDALIEKITNLVIEELKKNDLIHLETYMPSTPKTHVPVSISARHVHLQKEHLEVLFGKGYQLSKYKEISQPGQFACFEKVTLKGAKGTIENVRILAPLRKKTQVEVARSDARKLGISPPVRNSGNLEGSAPITIMGPKGSVSIEEGCIIADRHIHMAPLEAKAFGVKDQQRVSVQIEGAKGGIMEHVTIRVKDNYALDMHIDVDDANAFGLKGNELLKIIP